MVDIVERLRDCITLEDRRSGINKWDESSLSHEAADEITALRARIAELEQQLASSESTIEGLHYEMQYPHP